MPMLDEIGPATERNFPPNPDWADIVERIQSGDDSGMEALYRVFAEGIRFYLCRHLRGQELDDKIHDCFVIVVGAIHRGELREPERLMGFVRTVVRRQLAGFIDKAVHRRREHVDLENVVRLIAVGEDPEAVALARERKDLAKRVLGELSSRDREILTRFYLHEQTQEQICDEMDLTETQFRLLKSRAKARFADEGKRKLNGRALRAVMVRLSGTAT